MSFNEIGFAIKELVNEYGLPISSVPYSVAEGSHGGVAWWDQRKSIQTYIMSTHVTSFVYGKCTNSNMNALRALSVGIVFFPIVNPDGVR